MTDSALSPPQDPPLQTRRPLPRISATIFGNGPIPFVALISVPIAAYAISLLFNTAIVWMNHEYLIFSVPGALLDGVKLRWRDLFRGFDPWLFDVVRPRFINYVITIFNVKLRLLAYRYFIPPANFSIGFFVHLLFAPVLFYLLAAKLFLNRWMALLCTCFYVTSVGFLSAVAIFPQPGKNLIHTLTLALFLALAVLHEKKNALPFGEERGRIVAPVMFLNLIGTSIDEQWPLVAVVGMVFFARLFVPTTLSRADLARSARALTLYFGPFLLFFLFAVFAAPFVSQLLGSGRCDYLGYALQAEADKANILYWPLLSGIWTTALAASFLPAPFPASMSPFKLSLIGWPLVAAMAMAALLLGLIVKRSIERRGSVGERLGIPARLLAATIVYFLLQALLQRLHEQVTGGYYYESLSAIFISLLFVSAFAGGGRERWALSLLLPMFMIFQINNFVDLNQRWRAEHFTLTRALLDMRDHAYPNLVVDGNGPRSPEQAARMETLWNEWRRGEPLDPALMQSWPIVDGWFLFDLNALSGNIFKDAKPKCPGWFPGSGWWNVN